jgi:hypothetical protein
MLCIQILAEENKLEFNHHIFETVKWKSKSGVPDKKMIDAVNSMVIDLKGLKGFLHQSLYKDFNEVWVDVYYWETEEDAHASNVSMGDKASFKNLIDLIELDSVSIEILHQLQSSGRHTFNR